MTNFNHSVKQFFEKRGPTIVLSFLVFIFILYMLRKIKLQKQNCKIIQANSKNVTFYSFNELRNANYFKSGPSNDYSCKLKDFYYKGAYNCFSSGQFKNDYVDECALENCANSGVRFLDMQVFSLNKIPIVAMNHNDNFFQKDSYNHIDFNDAMEKINDDFLRDGNTKNHPLFLHLRLNYASSNQGEELERKRMFYNQVHDIIIKVFDNNNQLFTKNQRIFYNNYDDSREQIIANLPIEECENKVFVFITLNDNSSNSENFKSSKLNEITDLLSTSEQSISIVRADEIVEDNHISFRGLTKRKLVACLPQANQIRNNNYDFSNAVANGVQFICMNFQNYDSMMNLYNDFFISQIGSSSQNVSSPMIKKPDMLIDASITNESFFIPSMTYKIVTGIKSCYDTSGNQTDPIICKEISSNNYQLFNIYQSLDNKDNYYFKTSIQEKICDLSGDDLIYCNLNDPDKTSYFNFTRTGANTFKIRDASNNNYCRHNSSGKIECSVPLSQGDTFEIKKTLL
tara:strand:+ start:1793 stop:3334 length:1542 start_codon:yes stop_codon:yes gene_type:complete